MIFNPLLGSNIGRHLFVLAIPVLFLNRLINPQAKAWGYTDKARLRGLMLSPQAKAWGYTDEARLRGLMLSPQAKAWGYTDKARLRGLIGRCW